MSQQIITRTVSAVVDQRIELANGQIARSFDFLDDWNVLRIGMQLSIPSTGANITGTPQLVFGILKGTANGYANATSTTHFLGIRTRNTTMDYNAGPPVAYGSTTMTIPSISKKVGLTLTDGSSFTVGGGTGLYISDAANPKRCGLILEITKGTPNFTVQPLFANTLAAAQADLTDAEFLSMMEASTMAGAAAVKSGYVAPTGLTIAIDEVTDGAFDSICAYWDRTTPPVEISQVRHRKIS